MFLPKFDLPQVIRDFNHRKEKNIKTDASFGCPFLKKSLLADCTEMIDAINDAADLFYFSDEETALLQQRGTKIKTWRATAKSSNDSIRKVFDRFKQAYELPPELASKKALYDWRKQHHIAFSNTENWINLTHELMPLTEFHQLKADWKGSEIFALHSSRCLSVIATKLLPNLIEHHKLALKDLKWNYFSMPSTVYIAYRKYLKSFLEQAKQLQQKLADAMCDRLQVFVESKLTHADVVVHIADKLKIEHPLTTEKLTSNQFLQFSHFIQKHGKADTKNRWEKLSCFNPSSIFPLQAIGSKEVKNIVPTLLADSIPNKPRRPAWLFKGSNLRYEFCEKHALDFVALQQLPNVAQLEVDAKNIQSVTTALNAIQTKQQLANKLLEEIKNPPYSNLSRWHWRTHNYLKQYQGLLYDYHRKTVAAQLLVAEKLAEAILQNGDKSVLKMPYDASRVLSDLLQSLQSSTESSNDLIFKKRLQQLQAKCHEPLALKRVAHLVKKAAEGQVINEEDLFYVKTVLDNSETAKSSSWQQFTQQLSRNLLQILLNELKRNPEAITKQERQLEHYSKIRQACNILQLLAPKYDAHSISKPLTKYFLYYLNAILRCGNESKAFAKNESLLVLFESVIDLFPKAHEIFIGNHSIAECLGKFKNLRAQKDWIEIQAEAESLAFTLGEKLLTKRVDNACNMLDEQIKDLISQKMKPGANSPLTGALLFQVRDQLTKRNKQRVDSEIIDSLKTHEQVMLGMKQSHDEMETRDFIPALIEFSSQAQQLQKVVHDDKISYADKFEQVFAFQESFDKALSRFKQTHSVSEEFDLGKKSTLLFFKPYTALSAPTAENNNTSNNSANLNLTLHNGR